MAMQPSEPWYVRSFRREYLDLYPRRTREQAREQVTEIEGLLRLTTADRILDACCGAGRHAAELLRRGYRVHGFDLSADLLRDGLEWAVANGIPFSPVQADLRAIPFRPSFDVVLSLFTSLGYFPTDAENIAAIRELLRPLVPGGRFLLDLPNRDFLADSLVPHSRDEREGVVITSERTLTGMRVEKTTTVASRDGERVYKESVRLFSEREMQHILADAGMRVTAVYGDFDGRERDTRSERMIIVGAKGASGTALS